MADSSKGLDFYPEAIRKESHFSQDLENPKTPKVCGQPVDTNVTEQGPCTRIVALKHMYESIGIDTASGLSGEEIMQRYGFERRRNLELFLLRAARLLKTTPIILNFETNLEQGEKPLHPLKIGRDGSLRISAKQIKRRAKIDAPEGTEFIIKPLDAEDTEEGFKIIKLKKPINAN